MSTAKTTKLLNDLLDSQPDCRHIGTAVHEDAAEKREFRATDAEWEQWETAAKADGCATVSAAIVKVMNEWAARVARPRRRRKRCLDCNQLLYILNDDGSIEPHMRLASFGGNPVLCTPEAPARVAPGKARRRPQSPAAAALIRIDRALTKACEVCGLLIVVTPPGNWRGSAATVGAGADRMLICKLRATRHLKSFQMIGPLMYTHRPYFTLNVKYGRWVYIKGPCSLHRDKLQLQRNQLKDAPCLFG